MNKCNNCTSNYSCNVNTGSDFQPSNTYGNGSFEQNISEDNANVQLSYMEKQQEDTNANVQVSYMSQEKEDKDSLQKGYLISKAAVEKENEDEKNELFKHHDSLEKSLNKKGETNATTNFQIESSQSNAHIEDIVNRDNKKGPQDLHSKNGNAVPTGFGNEIIDINTIGKRFD